LKVKNRHVYDTPQRIREIKEEIDWIGRNQTELVDEGHLVILALPRKPEKKKKHKEKGEPRGKRREQKPKSPSSKRIAEA
jgi:hypothetical protein